MNTDLYVSMGINMLAVSLANIKDILGIVSICITLAITVFLLVTKVYKFLKDGKLTDAEKSELKEDLKDISDTIKNIQINNKDGDK